MEDLISTEEASRILVLTHRQTARLCENGTIKARKLSREWIISKKSVMDLLEKRQLEQKQG